MSDLRIAALSVLLTVAVGFGAARAQHWLERRRRLRDLCTWRATRARAALVMLPSGHPLIVMHGSAAEPWTKDPETGEVVAFGWTKAELDEVRVRHKEFFP